MTVGKDFFSIRLKIILLEDLPVSLDDSPDTAQMVLDEEAFFIVKLIRGLALLKMTRLIYSHFSLKQ